jgi:hypothetical protein
VIGVSVDGAVSHVAPLHVADHVLAE